VREPTALKGSVIQYLGFGNVNGRREYVLDVQRGKETRRYTVWIELAAFSRGQALLQDGPDICYQKLLRELADPEQHVSHGIEVTERDLAAYRESHAPPARRTGFSALPRASEPAKVPASPPSGSDGKVP
jgi:hypothetical protein